MIPRDHSEHSALMNEKMQDAGKVKGGREVRVRARSGIREYRALFCC